MRLFNENWSAPKNKTFNLMLFVTAHDLKQSRTSHRSNDVNILLYL